MLPGMPERRTHDYYRNGITTLFVAFEVADGTVISQLHRQHRASEFKKFLITIDKTVPEGLDIHLVCDNYGTHKTPAIKAWLAKHPRSTCTSPRPDPPGLTRCSAGSAISPTRRSAAAPTRASSPSKPTSPRGSHPGTPTRSRSSGRSPPRRSSLPSHDIFNEFQARDTSGLRCTGWGKPDICLKWSG